MWSVRLDDGTKYYLLLAKEYSVGRKGDIQVEDKSVSRVHLTLEVAHSNKGSTLLVTYAATLVCYLIL
jgi:hypothetical protein